MSRRLPSPRSHCARAAASGVVVADRLRVADTHWSRLKGLLGTRSFEPGHGLWLKPCRQVHMIGMRYAVDLAFLDDRNRIVRTITGLPPGKVSPRVAGASSVLELPPGTLARVALTVGDSIAISSTPILRDDMDAPRRRGRLGVTGAMASNLVLAALFAFFASAHLSAAWRTGQWATTMPMIAQEALLVVLLLTRRRSMATSSRPFDWAVAVCATFLPLLMRPADVGPLRWLGQPIQMIALVLALVATGCLGRSIGVVAADRGIKTAGVYRLLRHPMYAAYLISYVGYTASYPSPRNCVITAITLLAMNARAGVEERFLARTPAYREYLERVRWRFAPYLY
jgi:protein-S-isoprenylcysteine O-methyltransferase Ste14/uncharacterized membrane protein (UPF0127 family)